MFAQELLAKLDKLASGMPTHHITPPSEPNLMSDPKVIGLFRSDLRLVQGFLELGPKHGTIPTEEESSA